MSKYQKSYYEKNKEELTAKQLEYYQLHKEEIKAKQRARYEANKEEIKAKQKALREAKKAANPKPKKQPTPKQLAKKFLKPFKEKFKGFKFEMNDNIVAIEIKNPFRLIKEEYGVKHCDEEGIKKIQFELRRRINKLSEHNSIIIFDCQYTQLFLSKEENLDKICEETRNFMKEKLAIYGQYYKNNKKCNKDFE